MGQVLHGSATTTEAVRRAIQHSQESLRALARRYGVNPKTIAKWKARTTVADLRTGPKEPRSTVLTVEEEAVVVAGGTPCCRSTIAFALCSRRSCIYGSPRTHFPAGTYESRLNRRDRCAYRYIFWRETYYDCFFMSTN